MHSIRAIYDAAGTIVGGVLGLVVPALAAIRARRLMLRIDHARLDQTVAALKASLQLASICSNACGDTVDTCRVRECYDRAQIAHALRRVEESEPISRHRELNEALSDARRHLNATFDLVHNMAAGSCDDKTVTNFKKAYVDFEDRVVLLDEVCQKMEQRLCGKQGRSEVGSQ